MTVREYIGARYVPVFSDPIQWDSTVSYEPLTVVMNQGTSYVSKQSVPAGIDILNETYWLRWADYNAQLEEYIRQVQQYNQRIQDNTDDIDTINDALPIADFGENNTVKDYIDDNIDDISELLPASVFNSTNTVDARFDTIEANSWVTNNRIANNTIKKEKLEKSYMVVIGDSFSADSQSGTPLWYTYVAQWKNLNVYTNASDGMGYTVGGQNDFYHQIDKAVTAMQGKQVEVVYIVGGLNDTRSGSYARQNFTDNVSAVFNHAIESFPNSKIEVYGPQSFVNVNDNSYEAAYWMAYLAASRGIEYHDLTNTFQFFDNFFGGKTGTNEHPTATGERIMASCIMQHGAIEFPVYVPGNQLSVAQMASIKRGSITVTPNVKITKSAGSNRFCIFLSCIANLLYGDGSGAGGLEITLPNKIRPIRTASDSHNNYIGNAYIGGADYNKVHGVYGWPNASYCNTMVPVSDLNSSQYLIIKIEIEG